MRIMVVDDERIVRESFFHWFTKAGHAAATAESAEQALLMLEKDAYDVLFVDLKMPGMGGMALLEAVREGFPDTLCVIITAFGTIETAVTAMKLGAFDYLLKPFKPEQLHLVLEKLKQQRAVADECRYLRDRIGRMTRFDNIVGNSPPMLRLFAMIEEIAGTDASVLITGETGTGKELVAKAVHATSARSPLPFVAINCGALSDTLLETELFGHRKGAFTGADHARKGFFEVVSGGTLFLDEIGEISHKMQVELLRVLDEKKIRRVGSSSLLDVDFRLISATCRDIEKKVRQKAFREDFFYRINVITLAVPPLRDRREDIPLLAEHFMKKFASETNRPARQIRKDAVELLASMDWPGNVRELMNAIERAVILSRSQTLTPPDFVFLKQKSQSLPGLVTLDENERLHILRALEKCAWNVTQAAGLLGIHRVTLHKKIRRYGLQRETGGPKE